MRSPAAAPWSSVARISRSHETAARDVVVISVCVTAGTSVAGSVPWRTSVNRGAGSRHFFGRPAAPAKSRRAGFAAGEELGPPLVGVRTVGPFMLLIRAAYWSLSQPAENPRRIESSCLTPNYVTAV